MSETNKGFMAFPQPIILDQHGDIVNLADRVHPDFLRYDVARLFRSEGDARPSCRFGHKGDRT